MTELIIRKVFRAALWRMPMGIISKVLRLVIGALLSRILTPKEFGLIGMIRFFSGFIMQFSKFGFGPALVQKAEVDELQFSSIHWMNLFVGIVLTGIMMVISPFIASFYGEHQLQMLSIVLATTFFISSITSLHNTMCTRNMDFAAPVIARLISLLIGGGTALVLVFRGLGVWSLVWQAIIAEAANTGLLWIFSKWRPRFQFQISKVKELLRFGLNLQGSRLLDHFSKNTDKLVVGKYIGATGLGYYDKAFSLMLLSRDLTKPLGYVLFPAFSRVQDDLKSVSTGYLRCTQYLFSILFPLMFTGVILAEEIIIVLYGEQWYPSVPLMKMLCVAGTFQAIEATTHWIFLSQGRTEIQLKLRLFQAIVRITSLIIGVRWGIKGVAFSYTLASALITPVSLYHVTRLIKLSLPKLMRQFLPGLICTAIMGMVLYIVRNWLYLLTDMKLIVLICSTGLGVISYTVATWFINRETLLEFRTLIKRAI